jgi:hypothetical protein
MASAWHTPQVRSTVARDDGDEKLVGACCLFTLLFLILFILNGETNGKCFQMSGSISA